MQRTVDYARDRSFWAEGDHPLEPAEEARVRPHLLAGETLLHAARGRSDGRKAIWVVTDRRFLAVGTGWFARHTADDLASVTAVEVEEGMHGWTLRVQAGPARRAIVAVAPALGEPLVQAIARARGLAPVFIASRRARKVAAAAEAPAAAVPPPGDAPITAPAAPADASAVVSALREAAELHRAGALTDEEFAALKRRLLGA